MSRFQTIGILGKRGDPGRVGPTVRRLAQHLKARGRTVLYDFTSAELLGPPAGQQTSSTVLGEQCDLAVVVGGDGTLLGAARTLAAHDVPLVGINLGRLGFLADVSPDQIESCLDRILDGAFAEEARCMLKAELSPPTSPAAADSMPMLALNDVVVHKWNTARMIELETYIDGTFVNAQRADGIIGGTPTGSTAYALSGGGPLLHPALDVIVLVSICPHTMSNRPLVVPGGSRIEIRVGDADRQHAQVTCDGQTDARPQPLASVLVERAAKPVRLLHPRNHDHYAILRAKLGWSGHPPAAARQEQAPPTGAAC